MEKYKNVYVNRHDCQPTYRDSHAHAYKHTHTQTNK